VMRSLKSWVRRDCRKNPVIRLASVPTMSVNAERLAVRLGFVFTSWLMVTSRFTQLYCTPLPYGLSVLNE
jgi:hypothetical protein